MDNDYPFLTMKKGRSFKIETSFFSIRFQQSEHLNVSSQFARCEPRQARFHFCFILTPAASLEVISIISCASKNTAADDADASRAYMDCFRFCFILASAASAQSHIDIEC